MKMADLENDLIAVQTAIGKENTKILFISRFKHEGKGEKGDIRILAITPYRFYVVTTKQSPKVDFSFHILELFQLEESSTLAATLYDTYLYQLSITIQSGEKQIQHAFVFEKEDTVLKVISYCLALLKSNFVNANVDKQVAWKVSSPEKQDLIEKNINNLTQQLHSGDGQPCGSFSLAYLCVCDYYKQTSEHNAEVCWDIDTIYAAHSCKDFDLDDFDRLDMKDLIPLIGALSYNRWFTKFTVTSRKLTNEVVDVIVKVIRRTLSIEEFILQDCHLNKDNIQKIALALGSNPNKVIKRLDLSKNNLEDKGVGTVAGILGSLENGLELIKLNDVSMTSKGGAHIANCLKNNKLMPTTLSVLNLSGNQLRIEGTQSLCEFLSQPNVLTELLLSNTECSLDLLFTALHRGCQLSLQILDFSGNPFFGKKPKESSQSLSSVQQFFSMSRALRNVNLSNTKLPASGVKAILVGLLNNPILTDVGLDLSNNELKSSGAAELTSCLKEISLSKLNLANNGLEQEIIPICKGIQNNCSIKELDLSSNVTKAKGTNLIAEALGDILMADTPLTKLSVADNRLKGYTSILFDCLGTNDTLTFLDIRGNGIGESARLLAKALQINTSLREILIDRNGITAKGLHDIAQAMDRNFTLCSMPLPMTDLSASMKANNSNNLFIKSYGLIEKAMIRNQSAKETSEQAYKVHQGMLMNSIDHYTQQTDEYVLKLSNTIGKVKSSENGEIQKEVVIAEKLIQEADLFRQVLLELYSDPEHSKNMLDDMFSKVTNDVVSSVECVVKENINKMLKSAANICPTALNKEEHLQKIKEELLKRSLFEKSEISSSIMKLGQSKISYKLCESNLLTATSIAEQLKLLFVDVLCNSIDKLNTLFTENSAKAQVNGDHKNKPEDITIVKTPSDSSDISSPPVSTPAANLLSDISKENKFDLAWDFSKKRDTVSSSSLQSEDGDNRLSPAARNRMFTDSFHKAQKKKACSLKRRPTVYKQKSELEEVEIPLESPDKEKNDVFEDIIPKRTLSSLSQVSDTGSVGSSVTEDPPQRSNSFNKVVSVESPAVEADKPDEAGAKEEYIESIDHVDGGEGVKRLPSIGAFDDIASNTTKLNVISNRAKPARGRRAPTKVSKLAHMTSVDELLDDGPSESVEPTPKPRPKSEMPLGVNVFPDESGRPRVSSEKVKREPPARPSPPSKPETPNRPEPPVKGEPPARPERPKKPEVEKKDSSAKEKKVKPPAGAFVLPQLPGLGGILKKRPAPKVPDAVDGHVDKHESTAEADAKAKEEASEEANTIANGGDVEVHKPVTPSKAEPSHNTEHIPPTKPPPPMVKKKPPSPHTEGVTEVPKSPEHGGQSEAPKPAPVKKPPRGIPLGGLGGSALMAEMNKKLHITPKTEEENHDKTPAANTSTPPTTPSKTAPPKPEKPEKPTPPQRPPSMKRSTSEAGNKPSVPNRPKSIQRPKTVDIPNESEEKVKPEKVEEKTDESSTEKQEGKTESKETEPSAESAEKESVPKEQVYV